MGGRLDKAVCDGFLLTRTEAKRAIAKGAVTVDGIVIKDPAFKIEDWQRVALNGKEPAYSKEVYLMMNKPVGFVSANEDKKDKTVFSLLPPEFSRMKLGVCGRLDKDSEGLLILTNDGQINHRITSPKYSIPKLYRVVLNVPATAGDIAAFEKGVVLSDFTALPAKLAIDVTDGKTCYVTISEGKFHQVKRMFLAQNKEVLQLKRLQIGEISLDSELSEGEFRHLTGAEIDTLKSSVGILTKKT